MTFKKCCMWGKVAQKHFVSNTMTPTNDMELESLTVYSDDQDPSNNNPFHFKTSLIGKREGKAQIAISSISVPLNFTYWNYEAPEMVYYWLPRDVTKSLEVRNKIEARNFDTVKELTKYLNRNIKGWGAGFNISNEGFVRFWIDWIRAKFSIPGELAYILGFASEYLATPYIFVNEGTRPTEFTATNKCDFFRLLPRSLHVYARFKQQEEQLLKTIDLPRQFLNNNYEKTITFSADDLSFATTSADEECRVEFIIRDECGKILQYHKPGTTKI